MKPYYIVIPLITLAASVLGSRFTSGGIASGWYDSIVKPSWTPPGWLIGIVWTVIFILAAASAILAWRALAGGGGSRFLAVFAVFAANAAINVLWSWLFFSRHLIGVAAFDAGILCVSVVALIALLWAVSPFAASLLIPYAAWAAFATYLNAAIWRMNA